ncbi:MAG: hypothetical protein FWF96_01310, partial [Kiritimatiellaeota bacterium]|nr:hypothetical protein [Kiritimatiellota bacterium]
MTPRERILNAVEFKPTDRIPLDLAGMRSTGISCFAYPKLVKALGLPYRRPRVYDTGQMLALPDLDVLDALGCDTVIVENGLTNAFPQPELWRDHDFNGRLPAQVQDPSGYKVLPDGTITLHGWASMPPASTVFTGEHAGCGVDLSVDVPPPDVEKHRAWCETQKITPEAAQKTADFCHRVRDAANGRAVFAGLGQLMSGFGIGMGVYPVQCTLYPEEVGACHAASAERCVHNMGVLLPLIKDDIDILILTADDWGTQTSLVAAPGVFRGVFKPHYRRINDAAHTFAPRAKTFMHTCGAVYPLIQDFAESGFDIMNPVQWCAGGQTPAEWKAAANGKIAFWGEIDRQYILPFGTEDDVRAAVRRVASALAGEKRTGIIAQCEWGINNPAGNIRAVF